MRTEYEIYPDTDKAYAVLWRDTPTSQTDPCPFCHRRHYHGLLDGHCLTHCPEPEFCRNYRETITTADGTVLKREDGYIVRTRNQENHTPDPERLKRGRVPRRPEMKRARNEKLQQAGGIL